MWQIRLELLERQNRGLPVTLAVFDREVDERREVVVNPSEWSPRVATAELHDQGTVIAIETLPDGAVDEIAELIPEDGHLVLDLRGVKWGVESAAIEFADSFVGDGVLAQWTGRRAGSRTYAASPGAPSGAMPIVVIGGQTEGVGEILASALQRHGATLVGSRTAGRAPYMSLVRDDEVSMWIPVAQWMLADEQPIDGNGIEPDEAVEGGDADEGPDPVVQRALELVADELEEAA
jgi:carboxyl-terminal processing protease